MWIDHKLTCTIFIAFRRCVKICTELEIGYVPSEHKLDINYESKFSFLAHNFLFIVTARLKIANSSASNHCFCIIIIIRCLFATCMACTYAEFPFGHKLPPCYMSPLEV